jgi:hypothetical protein
MEELLMSEMDTGAEEIDDQMPPAEIGVEAPEADAVEQYRSVRDGEGPWRLQEISIDVDPADAADQNRLVDLDEDDYR